MLFKNDILYFFKLKCDFLKSKMSLILLFGKLIINKKLISYLSIYQKDFFGLCLQFFKSII